jgi:enoyl-CoA hydratase/carnithine racemase
MKLSTGKILAEVEDHIGWITFNNPERRNAVSMEMWRGLGEAADAFAADANVRVVILRGAGDKAFASGADISEFDAHRSSAAQRAFYSTGSGGGMATLSRLEKPVVSMIRGFCIGGGLAIALNTDIRIATPGSTFGIPAARLGLGYGYVGVATLARLVGPSVAKDILFSARQLDADEALRVGLINRVVPEDRLEAEVRAYADRIAANAPLTVRAAKAAVQEWERDASARDLAKIESLIAACADSEDYAEGRRAFAEKRKPRFRGR